MSLGITLTIYQGVVVESLWLWETAHRGREKGSPEWIIGPGLSLQGLLIGLAVVGFSLVGISEMVGETLITDWLNQRLQMLFMGMTMFFILIAGAVGGWLIPRVNEYHIITALAVVLLNSINTGDVIPVWTVPTAGGLLLLILIQVLRKTPPLLPGKILLYLLFLAGMLWIAIQNGFFQMVREKTFSIPEAFAFGAIFTFFLLHALFGIRFLVITTAMIVPGNRIYLEPLMDSVFRDDQVAPGPFLLSLAALGGLMFVNQRTGWIPVETLPGIAILVSTQILYRPLPVRPIL